LSKNVQTTSGGCWSLARADSAARASAKGEKKRNQFERNRGHTRPLHERLLGSGESSQQVDFLCLRFNFGLVNSKVSGAESTKGTCTLVLRTVPSTRLWLERRQKIDFAAFQRRTENRVDLIPAACRRFLLRGEEVKRGITPIIPAGACFQLYPVASFRLGKCVGVG
jgi:hypothetical protein